MRWITFSLLSFLLMSPGLRAEQATATAPADQAASPAADKAASADTTSDEGTAAADTNDSASADAAATDKATSDAASESTDGHATTEGTTSGSAADSAKPMDMERVIVSSVAGAVALAGLATGITFGVMALNEYNCLTDVVNCNKDLDKPIEGSDYLDAKESVERNALYADMGYLVAATAATVAAVGAVELLFGSDEEVAE